MSKPPETLTTTEAESLLVRLKCPHGETERSTRDIRNYTIALLMLDAGLRVGEVCKLEIRDLVFNGQPVKSVTIRPEISKTKTERTVPLSERLQDALKLMLTKLPNAGVLRGTRPFLYRGNAEGHAALYDNENTKPLTTRQVQRIIADASLAAFGRRIHPHVLRHTFATRLMRVTNERVVQALLGHKSIASTQIYTHPNGDDMKAAVEAVSKNSGQGAATSS
jgi:site-specific recombinase XerD